MAMKRFGGEMAGDHGDTSVLGVILAGGRGRRMGTDKALLPLGGKVLAAHVADRLSGQLNRLLLNANGDPARFAAVPALAALPLVPDGVPGHPGPLAGLLAAMDWAAENLAAVTDILSVPADCPFLPHDLAARLLAARKAADRPIACARTTGIDGTHTHPVIGLWPVALRADLRQALLVEDMRRVGRWAERHGVTYADWPDRPFDPFLNLNTPEDAATALALLDTASTAYS